jgi:dihydroorotase
MYFVFSNVLLHQKHVNLHIQQGIITAIEPAENALQASEATVIDCSQQGVSIGWFDMRVLLPEPGFEYKETLWQGAKSAQKGGFTDITLLPNTLPTRQTKHEVAYLKTHPAQTIVGLHPIACVTIDTAGKDLTDMIDLHHAGAIAFSDGILPITHTGILLKTLQYLQPFDGLLIQRPADTLLTQFGVMHEGVQSTLLGLKGMPPLAETLIIQRDLQLLEYAGGKIHFSLISCKEAVQLIREAKKRGLAVTCDVAVHQLFFEDSVMQGFESFFKVNPPFRTQDHIDALWEGVADGTIDVIVSDHNPQDEESKNLELDMAEFGVVGLETFFPALWTANQKRANPLPLPTLLEKFTTNPRKILGLPLPEIAVGKEACCTFFDMETETTLLPTHLISTCKNSPFLGETLVGKATGTFRAGKFQDFK